MSPSENLNLMVIADTRETSAKSSSIFTPALQANGFGSIPRGGNHEPWRRSIISSSISCRSYSTLRHLLGIRQLHVSHSITVSFHRWHVQVHPAFPKDFVWWGFGWCLSMRVWNIPSFLSYTEVTQIPPTENSPQYNVTISFPCYSPFLL